jgi:hypothetical protein
MVSKMFWKSFFVNSSRTSGIVPVVVQVMLRLSPTGQTEVEVGAVRVTPALILKGLSETSLAEASVASLTRTFTLLEPTSATRHGYVPELPYEFSITTVLAGSWKLSVEYSSFTLSTVPVLVQLMVWGSPTVHT